MKRQTLFLIVLMLLVSICGASSAVTEDEFLWTNMNTDPVKSGAPNIVDLFMDEEEPIQLERITTYHWNNGEGAEPGTVSIYLGDALLSSWPAVGRSAYGTENVYWDAAVNIILMPGYTYTVRLSDEDSWSYNAASDNCGMIEFYGHRLFDFNTNKGQTDGTQDQCAVPDPGIEVILNNKSLVMLDEKGMPTGPIVLNETVYIPAPAVTQIMGMDISFDSTTNQVIVMPPQNINIVMNNQTINNTTVNDNSSGPVIINNTVYIPAPTVTQITGMDISFDSTTNQVIIMPAEEIKIVVNNETYSSTVINNNSFGPVIINDHVLLPIETVAEITGHKVDWDQNNHVLNITDPTETPAHGEEPISGYVWVLDRKEVKVDQSINYPDTYIYSYEGQKDGKEWMLYKFRWQNGEEYCHADEYTGCDEPPAAIKAGGALSLEMTARIENFGYHKTGSGWDVVPVDGMYIKSGFGGDGSYLMDDNGKYDLTLSDPNTNYAVGNQEKSLTVRGTVPDSKEIGDEMTISWQDGNYSKIIWYYKLQYIDSEADRDNNVLPNTDNTDTVPAETPAHGEEPISGTDTVPTETPAHGEEPISGTETVPEETPAHGEEPISGYVWVLDRKEVEVVPSNNPEGANYSYEGEKDGKEWMLYKFRYQFGEEYCHADEYTGCDVPPAAIKAGGALSLEMTARIENFGYHKTGSGYDVVPVGGMYITSGGSYLMDDNGKYELTLAEPGTNYALGNQEKYLTVRGTVPDSKEIGDEMTIFWHDGSHSQIIWYYKLQYIDNEAYRDHNVLPITDNTDTVPEETPARGYWKLTETTPYKMEDEYITANTKNHYGYDVINGGVRYTYDVTSGGTSDKDYYHFTAYGEVSDPPETGYPGEKLTMDLHCWVDPGSLEGSGNFSTYSSLYMGYCHNYLANWDYAEYACGNPWTNVNYDGTNENKTSFSSGDGYPAYTRMNESGQVCMIFPEGGSGDILEIESLLHIGDRHPLTTTWKYVFVEENQMTAG